MFVKKGKYFFSIAIESPQLLYVYYKAHTVYKTRFDSQGMILKMVHRKNICEKMLLARETPPLMANDIKNYHIFLTLSLDWEGADFTSDPLICSLPAKSGL